MKMLQFDISGRMAHFRKFYSNVTSLSYYFPPRNTVAGILAALLGMDRDTYYDLLGKSNLQIGLSPLNELRKVILTVDYLDIKGLDLASFRGRGMHPTKIEMLLPVNGDKLSYRIYLYGVTQRGEEIIAKAYGAISESRYEYPVTLGPAYCLAEVSDPIMLEADLVKQDDPLPINTVIPLDQCELDYQQLQGKRLILEERLPPDFGPNRKPINNSRNFIFEGNGEPIFVRMRDYVFRINQGDSYGVFM